MKNSDFTSFKNQAVNSIGSIVACILFVFVFTTASAQTGSVNFSGSWSFNESKSSPAQGGFRMGATSYVITQEGTNLTVESTRAGRDGQETKSTAKYTLDGKECSNTAFGNSVRKSVVTWSADGKTLSFAHTMNFERDGQTTEFKTTETWKINDADKTLVMESVFNSQNGEMKTTNVYDKK